MKLVLMWLGIWSVAIVGVGCQNLQGADTANTEQEEALFSGCGYDLYGAVVGENGESTLVYLDKDYHSETYVLSEIGPIVTKLGNPVLNVTGIDIHPISGRLFGVGEHEVEGKKAQRLMEIDCNDGTATDKGPIVPYLSESGASAITDISFRADGRLFGNDSSYYKDNRNRVVILNLAHGTESGLLNPTFDEDIKGGGLAFVTPLLAQGGYDEDEEWRFPEGDIFVSFTDKGNLYFSRIKNRGADEGKEIWPPGTRIRNPAVIGPDLVGEGLHCSALAGQGRFPKKTIYCLLTGKKDGKPVNYLARVNSETFEVTALPTKGNLAGLNALAAF